MNKICEVAKYYDKGHYKGDVEERGSHTILRFGAVLDVLHNRYPAEGTALDVGCGSGYLITKLASGTLVEWLGLDISVESLKEARRRCRQMALCNVDLLRGDAHRLMFRDGSFDLVTCTDVIEHVESPRRLLKEVFRVLKADGTAVISVPNWQNLYGVRRFWIERILKRQWEVPIDNWQSFRSARRLFHDAGFTIEDFRGICFRPPLGSSMFLRALKRVRALNSYISLEHLLSRTLLGHFGLYIIFVLRKRPKPTILES